MLSKKQILILFDLLVKAEIKPIDYSNSNRFTVMAEMFHALNGKSKSSWVEELKNYKNKSLYHYNSEGELKQLIKDLTSLSNKVRILEFRPLANAADKKIKELELIKRENGWE